MDEVSELQDLVAIGFNAEDFCTSALGKYVAEKAEGERCSALAELCTADPFDSRLVSRLQSRVAVADMAMQWLADAIIEGTQAQERLLQLDQTD